MNGGYSLIDCGGLELTGGKQTIAGLHKAIENAYAESKPIYACNMKWQGDIFTAVNVGITKRSNNLFVAAFSTLQLEVTESDEVTINNMVA